MKAIITGITGFRNRGVEAMVVTSLEQLSKLQPGLALKIMTRTPDFDELRLQGQNIELFSDAPQIAPQTFLQRLKNKIVRSPQPAYPMLHGSSVVIASGGDLFSSDYGGPSFHLRPLREALNAGIPIVFLAQSVGPFKKQEHAQEWVEVARRAKVVMVREKLSYNYVTKDLGLSPNLVQQTADPAFLLTPPPPEKLETLRKFYGITPERPTIAVSASQGISRFSNCNYEQHLKAWHKVISMIVNELGAQVLIVPHVQEIRPGNDDRILSTNLLRSLDFDPRVKVASADHSASEFKGLIGSCDMVVAERMHAAIAGLSSGTCTVAVGYSIKAEGIMTDLLGDSLSEKGVLISVQQFLDAEAAFSAIRTAWNQHHDIAHQLSEALPRVKQEAVKNFTLISDLLS